MKKHWKAVTIAAVVVMFFSVTAATCSSGGTVVSYDWSVQLTSTDPGFAPNSEFSMVPSRNPNAPELCAFTHSNVSGRNYLCRFLWGVESVGDNRNWLVSFTANGHPGGSPPSQLDIPGYGLSITTRDGKTYEGCYWQSPNDSYVCDYVATEIYIPSRSGCSGWCLQYFLARLWDWSHYELKVDLACADDIKHVLALDLSISNTVLSDCADSPK